MFIHHFIRVTHLHEKIYNRAFPGRAMPRSQYLIEKGCPLCKGNVQGNERDNFYCKRCRLLFHKEYLRSLKPKRVHKEKRDFVKVHFGKSYVTTARGKIFHVLSCPKLKGCSPLNLRLADPKKQSACACVKKR